VDGSGVTVRPCLSGAEIGRDWRALKQWMADQGYRLVKGTKGHPKYKRVLPLSRQVQVVTIPGTPSDALRGVRNTAGELKKLQAEALRIERAAEVQHPPHVPE